MSLKNKIIGIVSILGAAYLMIDLRRANNEILTCGFLNTYECPSYLYAAGQTAVLAIIIFIALWVIVTGTIYVIKSAPKAVRTKRRLIRIKRDKGANERAAILMEKEVRLRVREAKLKEKEQSKVEEKLKKLEKLEKKERVIKI